ncbi:hypothetical protein [Actinomadura sp. 9N215]|uniref:hypothetical protein n=1 Tax=Actinomadura sp. 9N215 TaxID=3375150 RepID=UPI0037B625F5
MEGLITLGAIALMFLLPLYAFGHRRGGRIKIRYGPSRTAQAGMWFARGAVHIPVYAVIYWYVSLPLIAVGTLGYVIYSIVN